MSKRHLDRFSRFSYRKATEPASMHAVLAMRANNRADVTREAVGAVVLQTTGPSLAISQHEAAVNDAQEIWPPLIATCPAAVRPYFLDAIIG